MFKNAIAYHFEGCGDAEFAKVDDVLQALAVPVLDGQRRPGDLQIADLASAAAHVHGRRARLVLVGVARVAGVRRLAGAERVPRDHTKRVGRPGGQLGHVRAVLARGRVGQREVGLDHVPLMLTIGRGLDRVEEYGRAMVGARDKGHLAVGLAHAAALDARRRSGRTAHTHRVGDGHLVDGRFGYALIVALHGVLGAYEAQIARSLVAVLRIVEVVVRLVAGDELAVEAPQVGEVDVGRLEGRARQEERLIDVGHD